MKALLSQTALSLDSLGTYVKTLSLTLLKKSFKEHVYWYASDRSFIDVGSRHISLSCKREMRPSDEILNLQNHSGVPFP